MTERQGINVASGSSINDNAPKAARGKRGKKPADKSKKTSVAKAKTELSPEQEQALIAKAKDALAALDAHGDDYLPKMLAFGEAAHQAKASKPHGEFKKWCQQHLQRSSSWVSTYRRLFEDRVYLHDALAWARATDHKLASCRSVERLLKVIVDFKARDSDVTKDNAAPPKPQRKAKEVIAKLQHRLKEAEADFTSVRELLPPEVMARTRSWATAAATGDGEAREALATFTQACHLQLRELLQTSSALEVLEPAPVAPSDPFSDTDEGDKEADVIAEGNRGGALSNSHFATATRSCEAVSERRVLAS